MNSIQSLNIAEFLVDDFAGAAGRGRTLDEKEIVDRHSFSDCVICFLHHLIGSRNCHIVQISAGDDADEYFKSSNNLLNY